MKILIFTESKSDFGSIYFDLSRHLHSRGAIVELLDWSYSYTKETFELAKDYYDFIVTSVSPNEMWSLINAGIPAEKLIGICHSSQELIQLLNTGNLYLLENIAGYAVVCEDLYKSSLDLGVKRKPAILDVGVTCRRFENGLQEDLRSVGFYNHLSHHNPYGMETKRGLLIKDAVETANLEFKNYFGVCFQTRPSVYREFGAFIVSDVQEGSSLYTLEAAASGKLVISTMCGQFSKKLVDGAGILAPTEEKKFFNFVVKTLNYYSDNPSAYREKCQSILEASRLWDWSFYAGDWFDFFADPGKF